MKNEKEIHAGFATAPQTAKVTDTVHDKLRLIKKEKVKIKGLGMWPRG